MAIIPSFFLLFLSQCYFSLCDNIDIFFLLFFSFNIPKKALDFVTRTAGIFYLLEVAFIEDLVTCYDVCLWHPLRY